MLEKNEGLYCGIFDSTLMSQSRTRSPLRTVTVYELELFMEGGGVSHINGNKYQTKKGMLLIARPGDKRYSDFPVRCSFIRLFPSSEPSCERILDSLPRVTYLEDEEKTDELLALFARLGSVCIAPEADSDIELLKINSLFFDILCRTVKLCKGVSREKNSPAASRIVREAYEYINENLALDCSLKTLAAAVHISPNYLHHIFCDQIGMTPHEYLTKKRIERAKLLIRAGERSMLEIALDSGFCSQSHFNKVFKEVCKISPAQYKRSFMIEY